MMHSKLSSHEVLNHEPVLQLADTGSFWSQYQVEMPDRKVTTIQSHEHCEFADGIMTDLIFKLTVNQLATSIRLHGIDNESMTMLNMLETLVIAGEIPFANFMNRMQNLFPTEFDRMDPALLAKLSSFNDH